MQFLGYGLSGCPHGAVSFLIFFSKVTHDRPSLQLVPGAPEDFPDGVDCPLGAGIVAGAKCVPVLEKLDDRHPIADVRHDFIGTFHGP
mgnify:FL=1